MFYTIEKKVCDFDEILNNFRRNLKDFFHFLSVFFLTDYQYKTKFIYYGKIP